MAEKPAPAKEQRPLSKALRALGANVAALIEHQAAIKGEYGTQPKVAAKAKVDQKTIWRIVTLAPNEPSLDKVEKIAKVFGLQAWQLLVPDLDPENAPKLQVEELAEASDTATKPGTK